MPRPRTASGIIGASRRVAGVTTISMTSSPTSSSTWQAASRLRTTPASALRPCLASHAVTLRKRMLPDSGLGPFHFQERS